MLAALEQARSTLDEFRRLLEEPRQHALVKVRFVSSTDQVEHLWGEVIEAPGVDELGIQLVTPPVTHVGRLEPVWRCTFADAGGRVHGGFTQRAMFAIARRDGVALPPELREQERDYS